MIDTLFIPVGWGGVTVAGLEQTIYQSLYQLYDIILPLQHALSPYN